MKYAKQIAWATFTAVFAVGVAFVFWGTWSLDVVPVMPDALTSYPSNWAWRSFWTLVKDGKFMPFDLIDLTGMPYFWQELKFCLALYLAGLGAAYFCRGRGLSLLASYGAGLLLSFSGYWMTLYSAGHYGWFQWMSCGVFAFGLADRAVRVGKIRHWLLLGATVSWAGFYQQDLWLLFTLFTSAYFIWCCVRERRLPWKGALLALATFVLIGLPNFKFVFGSLIQGREGQIARQENITQKTANEADRRWEFVTNWSMPTEDTLEFLVPRVHGDTSCPLVLSINRAKGIRPYTGALGRPLNASAGNYRQHSLYVGWVTCLLALVGVLFARKPDARFFLVAAILFYLLSLGRYCEPVYRLVFALPAGDLIRCPVKWHHLTEFSLAILAAYGIHALLQFRFAQARWVKGVLAGVILLGVASLASNAALYCAPVDVSAARKAGATTTLSIIERAQFAQPQVAEMVRQGRIRSVASYLGSPNHYLVSVIDRPGTFEKPETTPLVLALGLVSLLASLGAVALSVVSAFRMREAKLA